MNRETLDVLAPFLLMFVPIVGLTIRFAVKPVTDSILKVLQARQQTHEMAMLERRVQLMEQEMHLMRAELGAVSEQKEFYKSLVEPAGVGSLPSMSGRQRGVE